MLILATMKRSPDLGSDSIWSLAFRLCIPTCLAQAVMVLYSVVDRMFIGHIDLIGDLALAGVGVAAPITTLISSFAVLIGMGGAPIMAMRSGHGEKERAEAVLGNALKLLVIFSLILTPLFYLIRTPLLEFFGASARTLPYADEYLFYYLAGTPFAILSTGLNSYLINQGQTGKAMASVLTGAVLNIVLDPIFIFLLSMGVKGGAIATVISQVASTALTIIFLTSGNTLIKLKLTPLDKSITGRIFKLGFSPFLIIATDSLLLIVLNAMLQKYGGAEMGDILITCATIIQSCHLMVMNPLGGITGGGQGLVSFNYGAGNSARVKAAYRSVQTLATLYTVLIFIFIWTGGSLFIRLFTEDAEITRLTFTYLKTFTLMIIPLSFQYNNVDTFTALGQVKLALPLSLFRKTLFLAACIILPAFFGAEAAFIAEPLCDIVAGILSSACMIHFLPRILKAREERGLNI